METDELVARFEDAARAGVRDHADALAHWYRHDTERAGRWMVLVLRALIIDSERRAVFVRVGDPVAVECASDSFDWNRALDALTLMGVGHFVALVCDFFVTENVTLPHGFMSEILYVLNAEVRP